MAEPKTPRSFGKTARNILDYVRAHPRCKTADISKGAGVKMHAIRNAMPQLRRAGYIDRTTDMTPLYWATDKPMPAPLPAQMPRSSIRRKADMDDWPHADLVVERAIHAMCARSAA